MQIRSKLNSIEKRLREKSSACDSDIRMWAKSGLRYNELDDAQRTRYNGYWEIDFSDLYSQMGLPLDFKLEMKPQSNHVDSATITAVERIVDEFVDEYNSPQAVAQRKAEYREIQTIGEQRRQAFARGESMNNYPLPWEENYVKG